MISVALFEGQRGENQAGRKRREKKRRVGRDWRMTE